MSGIVRTSAQKSPRNRQEAKGGSRGCSRGRKVISVKETKFMSHRGCKGNGKLRCHCVSFYGCLCTQTCYVGVGLRTCVREHLCGGERTT